MFDCTCVCACPFGYCVSEGGSETALVKMSVYEYAFVFFVCCAFADVCVFECDCVRETKREVCLKISAKVYMLCVWCVDICVCLCI